MELSKNRLVSAYRRRTACATLGVALMTVGIVSPSVTLLAQDAPPDNKQTPNTGNQKKNGGGTIRVVPMPRKDQPGRAGAPPAGAPPLPTLPGGFPPGGAPPGFPGGAFPGGAPPGGLVPAGVKPGTLISFDFHGTDIGNVLKMLSMATGQTIITDQSVTGPVTIISPKQVTVDEAFKILQSVLAVRGFSAQSQGNVITISPLDRVIGGGSPKVIDSPDPSKLDPRNSVMTQVIPLENVDAEAMAKDLQPLITKGASLIGSAGSNTLILTDYSTNIQRIIDLVDALDKSSNRSEMAVYQLSHAEATPIAQLITDLYGKITTRGKGGGAPAPGTPGFNPNMPQGAAGGGGKPAVVAVADARTNSVIVVASRDIQEQITKNIINRLDDDDTKTLDTRFRKIRYADAQTVANMVNSVLSNMHGTGTSASSSGGGRNFGSFFDPFGFGGGGNNNQQQTVQSTDPFGKVVAEPRTNSVLITASDERMAKINELIDQLDVDVPVESTTFVIPLKNAQASDVASALSSAFGTGQNNNNNNPFGFFGGFGGNQRTTTTNGISTHTPIQRRTNTSSTGRSAQPPGPPNAPGGQQSSGDTSDVQGVPGIMTPNGFVPIGNGNAQGYNGQQSDDRTRQFGFFGGGRRQSISSSNGPQFGRGSNGSYVNLLQLQNNVYAVPSPNGDSIIVTTTPDNYEAIKGIIDALDVVPSQVMLEVIVAEVTLNTDQKFGFNLAGTLNRIFSTGAGVNGQISVPSNGSGTTTALDPAAAGLQAVLTGTNYSAILQAMSTDDKVRVLATPRVFTSNNQQALIDISTKIPYISSQPTNGILGSTTTPVVDFQNIGFQLLVTPRITRQGQVTVDVIQDASDLLRYETLGTGTNAVRAPVFNDRYTDTSVTIQDNETVVLGGLIRDRTGTNISKVPLLGDIPILGQVFRSREKTREKVELMIFITPRVINSTDEARKMTKQQGAPVIIQIPDIYKQQPNLNPNRDVTKPDPKQKNTGKFQPNTPNPNGTTPNPGGTPMPNPIK